MFGLFDRKAPQKDTAGLDFSYVSDGTYYFDSACQTLRPQQVIDAEEGYYKGYNACGHRVKYKWGERVDKEVEATRNGILAYLKKSEKEYTVVFTLNTTYGVNLLLHQLKSEKYKRIVTSEIEHNSVFLPTMTYAKQHGLERVVLPREIDGSLRYKKGEVEEAIVVVNTTSNIDGRSLKNINELSNDIRASGGLLLIDAAQTLGHEPELLHGVDFDAVFGSVHKMYGPSLGVIVMKKNLFSHLGHIFVGGGTVTDVREHDFDLIDDNKELFATMELGLQNWAGIIGMGAALKWMHTYKSTSTQKELSEQLYHGIKELPELTLLYDQPSFVTTFYPKSMDAHRLAILLGERNIMARSGYFCCHYYLKHKLKVPPLLRISLGLHNTKEDIDFLLSTLQSIQSHL